MSMRASYYTSESVGHGWFDINIDESVQAIELMSCFKETVLSMARDLIEHGNSDNIGTAIDFLKFAEELKVAIAKAVEPVEVDHVDE